MKLVLTHLSPSARSLHTVKRVNMASKVIGDVIGSQNAQLDRISGKADTADEQVTRNRHRMQQRFK